MHWIQQPHTILDSCTIISGVEFMDNGNLIWLNLTVLLLCEWCLYSYTGQESSYFIQFSSASTLSFIFFFLSETDQVVQHFFINRSHRFARDGDTGKFTMTSLVDDDPLAVICYIPSSEKKKSQHFVSYCTRMSNLFDNSQQIELSWAAPADICYELPTHALKNLQ